MQVPEAIRHMSKFIKEIARDNFMMIELGTWVGYSASIWGKELKRYENAKVLCIDNMYMPEEMHNSPYHKGQSKAMKRNKMVPLLLRNIKALGLEDVVFLAKIPFEKMSDYLKEKSIDFLYIDLGYNYEEQVDAFKRYLPLVKKGGWVGGDDYDDGHPYRVRAITEFLGEVKTGERFWYKQI